MSAVGASDPTSKSGELFPEQVGRGTAIGKGGGMCGCLADAAGVQRRRKRRRARRRPMARGKVLRRLGSQMGIRARRL
jgi:hypothetical protein